MENLDRDHQQEMAQLHSQVLLCIQPMYTTEVLPFYDNLCGTHLHLSRDSDNGFRTGCRNVSRQRQSFSGLLSPRCSFSRYFSYL